MENLKLENIRNRQYAINCNTQEEFDIVTNIIKTEWVKKEFNHGDYTCIEPTGYFRQTYKYFADNDYIIIPAKDFIEANSVSKDSLHTETESKKEFTLPEKWCVRGYKEVIDCCNKKYSIYLDPLNTEYENVYFDLDLLHLPYNKIPEGYTEITREEFINYYLKNQNIMSKENSNIIGYPAPYDLFGGLIEKGTLYVKVKDSAIHQPIKLGKKAIIIDCNIYRVPSEIVETWEPVYKEEPKELTREEITAKWVRDNDVKVGDSVTHTKYPGIFSISGISPKTILISGGGFGLMVDVEELEKVVEPVKEYIKYTYEDRDEFRDMWLTYDGICEQRIISIAKDSIITNEELYTYEEAFVKLKKLDGNPFGKEVIK